MTQIWARVGAGLSGCNWISWHTRPQISLAVSNIAFLRGKTTGLSLLVHTMAGIFKKSVYGWFKLQNEVKARLGHECR